MHTRLLASTSLIAAALAVAGCPDGREDLNGPGCEETATVVALDEETALGFAAQDLLDQALGTHDDTLTWARDDSTTPLTLTVEHTDGEARFIDSEPVESDGSAEPAIAPLCEDRVEVDVQLAFATDDGAFDEALDVRLTGQEAERAEVYAELDPDALTGTYDMDVDIDALSGLDDDYDERSLWLRGWFDDAEGIGGEVTGQISGTEEGCEDGEECAAYAAEVPVGTWGPAPM